MPVSTAIRGVPVTTSTQFYESDGVTPFIPSGTVTYSVRDFQGGLIVSGSATQNISAPQEWLSTFTVPTTAPISDTGQRYSISFTGSNGIEKRTNTDAFFVLAEGEPTSTDTALAIMPGRTFQDTLVLPSQATSLRFMLTDPSGSLLHDSGELVGSLEPRIVNTQLYYDYQVPALATVVASNAYIPYIIEWNYTLQTGMPSQEFHFLYVITNTAIYLIDRMYKDLDKARFAEIYPGLKFSLAEMYGFLYEGISIINSTAPTLTNWSIVDFPKQLYSVLLMQAQVVALRALYLAEGQAAFDMQGQTTQLNIDRTQFIQTTMSELQSWLDNNLSRTKTMITKSSGAGVLSVGLGPMTNRSWRAPSGLLLGRLSTGMPW